MNTALAVLAHALRMLIFDTTTTLRVLLAPIAVVLGCAIIGAATVPDAMMLFEVEPDPSALPNAGGVFVLMALGVLALLAYALMAILWHRHVLLNGAERPENLRPTSGLYFGYIGRAIVVAIAQIVAAIPVALVLGLIGGDFLNQGPAGPTTTLLGLLSSVIFIWIALRFSVVLPAAALGTPMKISESWSRTKRVALPLCGVAMLLVGLNAVVYLATSTLLPAQGILTAAVNGVVFIAEGLVFISILTTLYGHLVEGRSLGQ